VRLGDSISRTLGFFSKASHQSWTRYGPRASYIVTSVPLHITCNGGAPAHAGAVRITTGCLAEVSDGFRRSLRSTTRRARVAERPPVSDNSRGARRRRSTRRMPSPAVARRGKSSASNTSAPAVQTPPLPSRAPVAFVAFDVAGGLAGAISRRSARRTEASFGV